MHLTYSRAYIICWFGRDVSVCAFSLYGRNLNSIMVDWHKVFFNIHNCSVLLRYLIAKLLVPMKSNHLKELFFKLIWSKKCPVSWKEINSLTLHVHKLGHASVFPLVSFAEIYSESMWWRYQLEALLYNCAPAVFQISLLAKLSPFLNCKIVRIHRYLFAHKTVQFSRLIIYVHNALFSFCSVLEEEINYSSKYGCPFFSSVCVWGDL